jgi:hypothetical protein
MGPIGCPETSVRNYRYSLRNNPEERSSNENNSISANQQPSRTHRLTDAKLVIKRINFEDYL